ncbi:peptidoglycan editing factor PgeF [Mycobacterium sp. CBMA271]|uniref:peptidoglycan editing factor PgeF n=1 Tax=unclassified Mycobacteroides TaxID=2618759 RepID=UPI0012DD2D65|nr:MULTISPECIES: peptidoglycan editing factor PgeF [unclassified Mycobacteroides]MUM18665.1 laccase [Mycobacteroides sp. CBMA 326]MUM22627.1 peptidoglycan editing factor PgeF [Mycobacteroides sp. CBMA 271]
MGFRVRRVTTTRRGGVSRAPFDGFNLGDHVGDDPAAVAANRSRLAGALGLADDHLIWMQQVHGDHVHRVEGPGTSVIPETDALVTTEPGIALAVLTADCVPVLFADANAGVVAGAHAGRVGAKLGIVPRTVEAMVAAGAKVERISAFLGPAVSGRHYEVPADMAADVEAGLPGSRTTTAAGTPGLDLRAGIARQLSGLGVTAIDIDPRCTVEDSDLFSYRREPRTGRLASVIWLS